MEIKDLFLILLIILILFINNNIKTKYDIITNNNNSKENNNLIIKKDTTISYGDTPNLRGYIDNYRLTINNEKGGSKEFNDIIMNDDNLKANQVNYSYYESYRKKYTQLKE